MIYNELQNIIFELEFEKQIISYALLVLRELMRINPIYFKDSSCITELITLVENPDIPFYEWCTVLKEYAVISVEHSTEIISLFNYEKVIHYIKCNNIINCSYIADVFLVISSDFSNECIEFLHEIISLSANYYEENKYNIINALPLINLITKILNNYDVYELFCVEDLLSKYVITAISCGDHQVINVVFETWKCILCKYDGDFLIDFFSSTFDFHNNLQYDFLCFCDVAVRCSSNYSQTILRKELLDNICSSFKKMKYNEKLITIKLLCSYISLPDTAFNDALELDMKYSLYEKVIELAESQKCTEEEEEEDNIANIYVELINNAREKLISSLENDI